MGTKTVPIDTAELERAVAELQEQVQDLAEKVIGVKWDPRLRQFRFRPGEGGRNA